KNGVYNGCPENHLYVEMEDSGQERGEFRCIEYVYLHEELEEAAKSGSRELLDTTLQRLIEEWRERQPPQVERKV
ncbi:MAG: hypothetical protein J2P36_26120, partial [Ktedonobacteraceae bacterium]|nr:hypothetical protein [Ktedonobacteraceae bacterium]